jgi:branched-chain amino acid aminotransferase
MPIEKTDKIWMDGELVSWDEAKVHVLTHTLHYGSGVFEGIRAYPTSRGPAVFRLTDHMRRLHDSAGLIHMDIPYSVEELVAATLETIRVNKVESCYIRPIAYLGYGEMGLNPLPCTVNVSIAVWPWGTYLGDEGIAKGVRMKISTWRRMDPNINPVAAKGTGIYINSSLAKVEALNGGYDEAILLNTAGTVAEATGENVFVVKNGVLSTPPLSSGALEGITRDSVMTIARELGFEVREQVLPREMLYVADEVFFVGTAVEVTPIRSVDKIVVGRGRRGPITEALQQRFFDIVRGDAPDTHGWLQYLETPQAAASGPSTRR